MKYTPTHIYLAIFLLLLCLNLTAQNQGRNWVFSDSVGLRFNNDGTITQFISNVNGTQRHACAAVSDSVGELVFYAGGSGLNHIPISNPNELKIFRKDNGQISNFTGVISPGQVFTLQNILPLDLENRLYVFLHMEWEQGGRHMLLHKSELDKSGDAGMGEFTLNKRILINQTTDTLLQAMTPVRHANGRDWWIISHQWGNDTFFVVLIDVNNNITILRQKIGTIQSIEGQTYNGGNLGFYRYNSKFDKLIVTNAERLFEIYDFDRCTGTLSNTNNVLTPIANIFNSGEIFYNNALSSSGQYLYIVAYNCLDSIYRISQFDLFADDIIGSRNNIFSIKGVNGAEMTQISLAPDNKIYAVCLPDTIDTTNINLPNRYYLSVIEYPDLPFPACNFIPRGLWLNGRMVHSGLPDYIDYNLGPVDGSACDTLGIDAQNQKDVSKVEIRAFPNPTSGLITVELQEEDFILYDLLGNKLAVLSSDTQGRILLPGYLSNGIYILQNLPEDKLSSIHYSRIQLLRGN
jgi:hypothetical protein